MSTILLCVNTEGCLTTIMHRHVTQLVTTKPIRAGGDSTEKGFPRQQVGPKLPVNISSTTPKIVSRIQCITLHDPWDEFYAFMSLDQGGDSIIAHDTQHNVVALKVRKTAQRLTFKEVQRGTSPKIVALLGVFQETEVVTLAYEIMDVSLRQLNATVRGPLRHFEIAAICREVWMT